MFERNLHLRNTLMTLAVSAVAVSLTSCSSTGTTGNGVTPQHTIPLEKLKAGLPESSFKDATITFYPDSAPGATAGNKTQYISKMFDSKGGQFVAQCRDGKCFGLQLVYLTKPISKEAAQEELKSLLPADAGEQTKTSDKDMKAGKGTNEFFYYGDKYCGVVTYSDKTGATVKSVAVYTSPGEDVEGAFGGKTIKPKKAAEPADDSASK